ncbi:MAG: CoA transferase [Proteobacteria bacterium]|nr:CoA transferase [Pseudomonadota bacterium]
MKLEGIRVVDLSWFLPGPYLTTALADHGAEVIKVEPPGEGDPGRHIRPPDQRTSVFFRNMARGKKSVVLDLKSERGRADLFRLCREADVIVESFRPGVAARFGIGYEAVKAANPGIVYCSISAFGQDGAYPGRAAHDLALEAMTGVLSLTLGDDGRPAIPGIPVADLVSGLHALSGVLMALLRRQTTGQGDYIDVSMHEALMASCANVVGTAFTENRQPDVKQQRTTGGSAFYRIYDTADGRQLVLAGQEMKFVKNLLGALGKAEWAPLCEWPGAHQKPVMDFLEATFRQKPLAHWMEWLATLDICYGPVNTLPEAIADPNLLKRGAVLTDADGRKHFAPVVRFKDEPSQPLYREPLLGEHTAEVLGARHSSGAHAPVDREPQSAETTPRGVR